MIVYLSDEEETYPTYTIRKKRDADHTCAIKVSEAELQWIERVLREWTIVQNLLGKLKKCASENVD